jgi:hypothetical protein
MAFAYHEGKKNMTYRRPRIGNPDHFMQHGNLQVVCRMKPSNYTEVTAYTLASIGMAIGDYTKNAAIGQLIIGAKNGATVSSNGIGRFVAIVDTVNSVLDALRECGPIQLTAGGTVDIPSWNCFF